MIGQFGLLISILAPPGPSHALVVGGESFFHGMPETPKDLETSLGLPSVFTRNNCTVNKLLYISLTCVLLLELDVGEGEDDDTYEPSKHDFESGDNEDQTLTRDCNGVNGAKVGGYSGYHYVLINLPM